MRGLLVAGALTLAVSGAYGAGPGQRQAPAPDLGAGPHQDFQPMEGGNGDSLRPGAPEPQVPKPKEQGKDAGKAGASTGSSAKPSDQQDPEDERRATERKDKARQRPGYKDEAPSPRAAAPGANRVN